MSVWSSLLLPICLFLKTAVNNVHSIPKSLSPLYSTGFFVVEKMFFTLFFSSTPNLVLLFFCFI